MSAIWTADISSIVFTRVMNNFSPALKTKYKMQKLTAGGLTTWRNFSTSMVSMSNPIFPYITIVEQAGQERGQDLENLTVNAALIMFQVDVIDNAKESNAKECMGEVFRIMKTMRFNGKLMPAPNSKPQEYRVTARFERLMGSGDAL